jgi:hypothetical protein
LIDSDDGDFDTCGDGNSRDFSFVFEEGNETESSFSSSNIERFIFKLLISLNK